MNDRSKMHIISFGLMLSMFLCSLVSGTQLVEQPKSRFLAISDIHFNPLSTNTIQPGSASNLDALMHYGVADWQRVLLTTQLPLKDKRFHDTDNELLMSVFKELKQQIQLSRPEFILIDGDLFAHHLDEHFRLIKPRGTQKQYSQFLKTTLQYIAQGFLPAHIPVIPVVGNTDTDICDYHLNSQFNQKMAKIWVGMLGEAVDSDEFIASFGVGGYYRVNLPNTTNKMIVLNSILFSDRAGLDYTEQALHELKWLSKELDYAETSGYRVWIVMHIPPGIDLYRTAHKSRSDPDVEFWKNDYKKAFASIIVNHRKSVSAIITGHEHNDLVRDFHGVPLITIPSISPIFGNNPAYKMIEYDRKSLSIRNIETRYLPLDIGVDQKHWINAYSFHKLYGSKQSLVKTIQSIVHMKNKFLSYITWIYVRGKRISSKERPYYLCGVLHSQNTLDYQQCVRARAKSLFGG